MGTVQNEDEAYKLLHQKPTIVKAANWFALIWLLAVVAPAAYYFCTHTTPMKEYAVVKASAMAYNMLENRLSALTNDVLKKVDVSKYTDKIDIPQIKLDQLDKLEKTAKKAKDISSKLAKFGVKDADKITDATDSLKKQVDKVNKQIKDTTAKVSATLNKEVKKGLEKEVKSAAAGQVQKQLGLSAAAYKALVKGKIAFNSKTAATIYNELRTNKNGVFYQAARQIDAYAIYFFAAIGIAGLLILLIVPFVVKKIAKKLASTYTQCPYCHKVYLTKGNAFNILKMVKFW